MSDENEKTQEISEPENFSVNADYLNEMIDKTIGMESSRCESLRKMSGTLLTGASIISVALLSAAGPLFGFFSIDMSLCRELLILYAIIFPGLLISILLAVISQLRFGYFALPSPSVLREKIDDGIPYSLIDVARNKTNISEAIYQGLSKRNNIMRRLLTASAILVFVSIGFMLLAVVLLLPPAYTMMCSVG